MNPEIQQLVAQAKEAIGRGADPRAVEARFKELTGGRIAFRDAVRMQAGVYAQDAERLKGEARALDRHPASQFARMAAQGATFGFADEIAGAAAAVTPGGKGYKEARDASRQRVNTLRREAPGASLISEIGGGLVVPGVGAARVIKHARGARRLGLLGLEGAAAGALEGAGDADEDRAGAALKGAAVGAAAGAGLGLLGNTAARAANDIRQARRAKKLIRAGERTNDELASRFGEHTGIGAKGDTGVAEDIAQRKLEEVSDKIYKPLEEAFAVVDDDEILSALQNRHVLPAVRATMGKNAQDALPSFTQLQEIRSRLGEMASNARKRGHKVQAREYAEAGKELTNAMERRIPGYAQANSAWREALENKNAFDLGRRIWNKRPEEIKRALDRLGSDEAKHNAKMGMATQMYRRLSERGGKITLAQIRKLESLGMRARLQSMFSSNVEYAKFVNELKEAQEIIMAPEHLAKIKEGWRPLIRFGKAAAAGAAAGAGFGTARGLLDF